MILDKKYALILFAIFLALVVWSGWLTYMVFRSDVNALHTKANDAYGLAQQAGTYLNLLMESRILPRPEELQNQLPR